MRKLPSKKSPQYERLMKLIEVVQRNYNLVKYQNHAKSSDNSLDPADLTISLQSCTETISVRATKHDLLNLREALTIQLESWLFADVDRTDLEKLEDYFSFLEAKGKTFRTGYLRNTVLRVVKNMSLSPEYIGRLKRVALISLKDSSDHLFMIPRLMIRHADIRFVQTLHVAAQKALTQTERVRTHRLISMILIHRKDLRVVFEPIEIKTAKAILSSSHEKSNVPSTTTTQERKPIWLALYRITTFDPTDLDVVAFNSVVTELSKSHVSITTLGLMWRAVNGGGITQLVPGFPKDFTYLEFIDAPECAGLIEKFEENYQILTSKFSKSQWKFRPHRFRFGLWSHLIACIIVRRYRAVLK